MLGASSSLRRTKALEREARARRREEERSNRLLVQLRADLDSLASSEESDEENKMADAPALYHGVHTEDAEAWFKQVEWWLQTKRATDDQARIGHVAGLLRDSARTWFQALNFVAVDSAADTPGLRTFADFREAF